MRPSAVRKALEILIDSRRPVFVWGPPGVGKSDVVEQIAVDRKIALLDFRMALRDPTDLKGFPMPDTKTKTMKFFRDDELPTKGKGILFFDEMNSAAPATQAAAMQLTLTGRIGDYVLPEGWAIVAAGNRESDRSVVNRMPAALANRFVHLDFEVHLDDWCSWAIQNNIQTEIIAFLRFRANLLHAFNPAENPRTFPTPRAWSFVNDIIKKDVPSDIQFDLFKGTVGDGAASEFVAFIKVMNELPSIDQIILNPLNTPVPESPATLYALTTSLGMKASSANFDNLMKYAARMPTEFQVVFVRDAVRRCDEVCATKSFLDWGVKNANVLT